MKCLPGPKEMLQIGMIAGVAAIIIVLVVFGVKVAAAVGCGTTVCTFIALKLCDWFVTSSTKTKLLLTNWSCAAVFLLLLATGASKVVNAETNRETEALILVGVVSGFGLFWRFTATGGLRSRLRSESEAATLEHDRSITETARGEVMDELKQANERDHELRYLLGCPEYADYTKYADNHNLADIYYLVAGGIRRSNSTGDFIAMLRAIDERDYPVACAVNVCGNNESRQIFIGKPGGTPLWTLARAANRTLILHDTAETVVYLPFDEVEEQNFEALLRFVSSYTSVADLFAKTVQRLGISALANCEADSPALEGLRGLIEIGPAIFTEQAGHLPEDPDLTLEHVRLAHSFSSRAEARATSSSPPPAG